MLNTRPMRFDCHDRRVRARLGALVLAVFVIACAAASAVPVLAVQEHAAAEAEAPHGQTILQSIAKVVNFAILGGVLFYFLKTPIGVYLASRATQIRQDLVTASDMRATAAGAARGDREEDAGAARGARSLEGAGCRGRQGRAGAYCAGGGRGARAADRTDPPRDRVAAPDGAP